MDNFCQGFCTLCGTGCAQYCRDYREMKAERDLLKQELRLRVAAQADLARMTDERDRYRAALEKVQPVFCAECCMISPDTDPHSSMCLELQEALKP